MAVWELLSFIDLLISVSERKSWEVEMDCFLWLQKIKELTYVHAEGIQAGELKHGPLALVDCEVPIIMVVTKDDIYQVILYLIMFPVLI